jgi:hypothetical protein
MRRRRSDMADDRFDDLITGRLPARTTRRAAAKPLAALGMLLGLATVPDLAAAKKGKQKEGKKKDKKKCKKREKNDQQATCPDACPDTCEVCAERFDGPPVCSDGLAAVANPDNSCESDNDCVGRTDPQGNSLPYCITGFTGSGGAFEPMPFGGLCTRMLSPCS